MSLARRWTGVLTALTLQAITCEAAKLLSTDSLLAFEVGYNQAENVSEFMKESFSAIKVVKDLAGIDRVVMGCRKQLKD